MFYLHSLALENNDALLTESEDPHALFRGSKCLLYFNSLPPSDTKGNLMFKAFVQIRARQFSMCPRYSLLALRDCEQCKKEMHTVSTKYVEIIGRCRLHSCNNFDALMKDKNQATSSIIHIPRLLCWDIFEIQDTLCD